MKRFFKGEFAGTFSPRFLAVAKVIVDFLFFISEEALRNTFGNYAVLILPFCILISINKLIAFNPGLFGRLSFVKFLLVKTAFVAREIKILATSLTLQCRPLSDSDVRGLRDKRSSLMWIRQGVWR